jgi:hypothetical protein
MTVRMALVILALLACCGVCHADEGRWLNFAEDANLKYYLDQKSVLPLPDNVYLFWVKSVAKDKEYFQKEFNFSGLSYIFTSYEVDCAIASYRVRGSILFDKNRKELSKNLPGGEPPFQPIPPESMLELAQAEICSKAASQADNDGEEETGVSGPARSRPASQGASTVPRQVPRADEMRTALPPLRVPDVPAGLAAEPEQNRLRILSGDDSKLVDAAREGNDNASAGSDLLPFGSGNTATAEPRRPAVPAEPAAPAAPVEPPTLQ